MAAMTVAMMVVLSVWSLVVEKDSLTAEPMVAAMAVDLDSRWVVRKDAKRVAHSVEHWASLKVARLVENLVKHLVEQLGLQKVDKTDLRLVDTMAAN